MGKLLQSQLSGLDAKIFSSDEVEPLLRKIIDAEYDNIKKLKPDERDQCVRELLSFINVQIKGNIKPEIEDLDASDRKILARLEKERDSFESMKERILQLKSTSYRDSITTILAEPDIKIQDVKNRINEMLIDVLSEYELKSAGKYIDVINNNASESEKRIWAEIKSVINEKCEALEYGEWKPGYEVTYDTMNKESDVKSRIEENYEETEFEYDDDESSEIIVTEDKGADYLPILKQSKSSSLTFSDLARKDILHKLQKPHITSESSSNKSSGYANESENRSGSKSTDKIPPTRKRP